MELFIDTILYCYIWFCFQSLLFIFTDCKTFDGPRRLYADRLLIDGGSDTAFAIGQNDDSIIRFSRIKFAKNLIPDATNYVTTFVTRKEGKGAIDGPRMGRNCAEDKDCGLRTGFVCREGKCECLPNYVPHNGTICLPGVLLGFSCSIHEQCEMRVPYSTCIQGFCRCGAGSVPYRRANCMPAALLGQHCRSHAQCSLGTAGSSCKWIVNNVLGRCQCNKDLPRRGKKCGPSGFALGAPCGKSLDCTQHVPGSICVSPDEVKEDHRAFDNLSKSKSKLISEVDVKANEILGGICQCPKGYFTLQDGSRCVSVKKDFGVTPVSLGKPCLYTSQCKASDPFTICEDGVCECQVKTSLCSSKNTGCFKETFQCWSDGRCVSASFVCDGKRDCRDGSDEASCTPGHCWKGAFSCADGSCISTGKVCDGRPDCDDGSDEQCQRGECPGSSFQCADGECVPDFDFCNAHVSCRDGSDEEPKACVGGLFKVPFCPFRCKNSRCRSSAVLCSGKDGCGDNSDEEKCAVCSCPKP